MFIFKGVFLLFPFRWNIEGLRIDNISCLCSQEDLNLSYQSCKLAGVPAERKIAQSVLPIEQLTSKLAYGFWYNSAPTVYALGYNDDCCTYTAGSSSENIDIFYDRPYTE
ncbi:MAG: hypothetical protein A4E53_01971 [Pelotomaculum sp. PtaB.Bin104]|nr:MAG: hypothetical protein A4E53_01971 [Pelotomaculum sp. PtaB.Bin104]